MQYCSLQYQTLLPSPVISTTRCCFFFGSISSFFLELFFHCSPVPSWAPTNLRSSSFSVLFILFYFICPIILFMGLSRQKYQSDLPFPSPVDHILSELSTFRRLLVQFSSVQLLSCVQLFATPLDYSTPGFPVHHQLLKLPQTQVH